MKQTPFRAQGTIKQVFGKELSEKSIAQGTIEYLVVIAIVVVIGLVVVGLLASFLGSSEGIFDSSSDIKNKVGVGGISIIDAVASVDENGLLVLKNVSSETLTITKINVDGVDHNYNKQINFGETKSFKLDGIDVCDGTKKSYTVVIYYTPVGNALDKGADFKEIIIDCTDTIITPNNVVEEEPPEEDVENVAPSISLTSPSDMNETTETRISFVFVPTDLDGTISDCNLNITGEMDANSISAVVNGGSNSIDYTLSVGSYDWNISCMDDDGDTNTSSSRSLTIRGILDTPFAWFASYSANTVTKLNTSTGASSGPYAVGSSPIGIAVDIDGNVWVVNSSDSNVSKLNGSTGAPIGTYGVGNTPLGIAIDVSGNVWVTNWNDNNVSKLNGSTGDLIGKYSVGNNPKGIAVDADGYVWVANYASANVSKLNSSNGELIANYVVGSQPSYVAVDADGYVWVITTGDSNIKKLNGSTGELIGNYDVGDLPTGIAVDADGNVWVTNWGDNTVSKLNGSTGTPIGTYAIGYRSSHPSGIAVDADGNVWVSNVGSDDVSKFNASTGALITTYGVGDQPRSIGDFTGFVLQYFVLGRR